MKMKSAAAMANVNATNVNVENWDQTFTRVKNVKYSIKLVMNTKTVLNV